MRTKVRLFLWFPDGLSMGVPGGSAAPPSRIQGEAVRTRSRAPSISWTLPLEGFDSFAAHQTGSPGSCEQRRRWSSERPCTQRRSQGSRAALGGGIARGTPVSILARGMTRPFPHLDHRHPRHDFEIAASSAGVSGDALTGPHAALRLRSRIAGLVSWLVLVNQVQDGAGDCVVCLTRTDGVQKQRRRSI